MSRETLVMLPGMMCDERLFAPQIAALKDQYDIIVPLLDRPASIEGMAKRILNEIKAPNFNLMGLSMGGIVAMRMFGLAPQRVIRLALLDTNHRADAPERFALRNRQIEDVRAGKLRQVITTEMKPIYLSKGNRKNQVLLDLLITMALDIGDETFITQSLALRDRADHSDILRDYHGPALVLCGEEDTLCPPIYHLQMAKELSRSVLREISNAGHITTLEQPASVTTAIRDWLTLAI
jgi:pimeloyl-ACP methyl ester carboxylesterase